MRTFALVIAALLIGYLLGGLAPNAKLESARDDLSELNRQLRDRGRKNPVKEVSALLAIPDDETGRRPVAAAPEDLAVDDTESGADASGVPAAEGSGDVPVPAAETAEAGTTLSNQLALAADAWSVRSELARSSFIDNTSLNDDEAVRFNVLVDAMNIRLEQTVQDWVVRIKEGGFTSEEVGVRMLNDFSDVLVVTYDEMDRGLPADWRINAGGEFNLTSLIDPEVIMPLAEVEDQLDF